MRNHNINDYKVGGRLIYLGETNNRFIFGNSYKILENPKIGAHKRKIETEDGDTIVFINLDHHLRDQFERKLFKILGKPKLIPELAFEDKELFIYKMTGKTEHFEWED